MLIERVASDELIDRAFEWFYLHHWARWVRGGVSLNHDVVPRGAVVLIHLAQSCRSLIR
jgi:hypothetical protein